MRICLVVPGFSANAQDWCIPALRHLVGRLTQGDDVSVLSLRYPYQAGRYDLFGARVTAVGGGPRQGWGSLLVWQKALRLLAAEHRRRPFQLIHAFWANETGALAALAGRALGVPAVVSLAGGELVGFPELRYGAQLAPTERFKVRIALRLARVVTAGSRYLLDLAREWMPASPSTRLQRIPLGVDLDLFRPPQPPVSRDPHRLIHVASLSPVKDQTTLLEAAAELRNRGCTFQLEIVGSGVLEPQLRASVERLAMEKSIRFRGSLQHHELPALYGAAGLFILSSRHEAQGMVALEAAACGLPVVGTRVGVVPELAPQAGAAVPVGDANALAGAIADLWADPDRFAALALAARHRVQEEFSLERSVQRFRALYSSLC